MLARIAGTIRHNLVAWLALFVALGGTSLAASHYVITSTKQIKPSLLKKLTGKTGKTGPTGPQGPAGGKGETGPPGANGASLGLSEENNPAVFLESNNFQQTVANIANVPAGNYIINAKTTLENESGGAVNVTCKLIAGTDEDEASSLLTAFPTGGSVETVALALSHTFASSGVVSLTCDDFTHLGVVAHNSKITLTQVQSLTRYSGIVPS